MSENNKKRSGSFRKFFPNLFTRHKGKNKETRLKLANNDTQSNQYLDPRSMIRSDKHESDDKERIYENLTVVRLNDSKNQAIDSPSNNSSTSTLVSISVRDRSLESDVTSEKYSVYAARPQVPPKPLPHGSEMDSRISNSLNHGSSQYPDVYYHSLKKPLEKITPFEEYDLNKASQVPKTPTSVGAEIKRVSTKFLISPKKEAEVRTIQPTRARSLSFDHENNLKKPPLGNSNINKTTVKKSYNYSAPTSPIPYSHRIPTMPKTVSPYELVRQNITEAEEKKNSLNSLRNMGSHKPEFSQQMNITSSARKDNGSLQKEKTRQKVEAFYWQKLKEMKEKEDEYYLRESLNSSIGSSEPQYSYHNSKCSTPIPLTSELRSSSLPRGRDLPSMMNQPMYSSPLIRGAPERRTDTYLKSQTQFTDPEIIYRRPEKLNTSMARPALVTTPIFQRGSLTRDNSVATQPKRVSFDENSNAENNFTNKYKPVNDIYSSIIQNNVNPVNTNVSQQLKSPPRPPVRTTSVGAKSFKLVNNRKISNLVGTGHSESESGSEAGEIQRILQTRK